MFYWRTKRHVTVDIRAHIDVHTGADTELRLSACPRDERHFGGGSIGKPPDPTVVSRRSHLSLVVNQNQALEAQLVTDQQLLDHDLDG